MTDRDDLGLSIDMLDADRLRDWAQLLLKYGPDISHWGGLPFVVSKMQTIATGIEKAVRDIGVLRAGQEFPLDEAITTYTPIMWASMTDEQRYEEYIRVRKALIKDMIAKCNGTHDAGPRCADPECWNQ